MLIFKILFLQKLNESSKKKAIQKIKLTHNMASATVRIRGSPLNAGILVFFYHVRLTCALSSHRPDCRVERDSEIHLCSRDYVDSMLRGV